MPLQFLRRTSDDDELDDDAKRIWRTIRRAFPAPGDEGRAAPDYERRPSHVADICGDGPRAYAP